MFRGDRLTALMKERGLTQSELARRVGVSQQSIWKLTKGDVQGSKHVHRLAAELATTPAYLMGEVDEANAGYVAPPSVSVVADELGLVEVREIDLSLGMGSTYLDVPVTETTRHFDRAWLRQFTHTAPEHLMFAQGAGDSMMPTLLDSDILLIDCSQQSLTMSDKIWAIAHLNCGSIKRLRPRRDGGVDLLSDNPAIPADIAYDGEMSILGRVVGFSRRI